jgi:hypothetical protein
MWERIVEAQQAAALRQFGPPRHQRWWRIAFGFAGGTVTHRWHQHGRGGNEFVLPEADGHQSHFSVDGIERENPFFFEGLDGAIGADVAYFTVVGGPQLFGLGHDTRFDGPVHDFEGKRVNGIDTRVLCLCETNIKQFGGEWGGRRRSVVRGELVHGIHRFIIAWRGDFFRNGCHRIDLQKNHICFCR